MLVLAALTSNAFASSESDRIREKIDLIRDNVNYPFRLIYQIKVIDGEEANAYAVGTYIVVTRKLLDILNERELTAVIAHEMAHRERAHMFTRIGMFVGGSIAALLDFNNENNFSTRFNGFNEHYQLKQELQADCYAYNWLKELERKGFDHSPKDLNSAATQIFGLDFSVPNADEYFGDLPGYIRFKQVERGHSKTCN